MTNDTQATLKRTDIRKVLQRHTGSISQVARDLGISHVSVSLWLKGRSTSARIADAANSKALQLLDKEKAIHSNGGLS